MSEPSPPFRFLTDEEFSRLSQEAKAAYLARAVQELAKMTASLAAASKGARENKDE